MAHALTHILRSSTCYHSSLLYIIPCTEPCTQQDTAHGKNTPWTYPTHAPWSTSDTRPGPHTTHALVHIRHTPWSTSYTRPAPHLTADALVHILCSTPLPRALKRSPSHLLELKVVRWAVADEGGKPTGMERRSGPHVLTLYSPTHSTPFIHTLDFLHPHTRTPLPTHSTHSPTRWSGRITQGGASAQWNIHSVGPLGDSDHLSRSSVCLVRAECGQTPRTVPGLYPGQPPRTSRTT